MTTDTKPKGLGVLEMVSEKNKQAKKTTKKKKPNPPANYINHSDVDTPQIECAGYDNYNDAIHIISAFEGVLADLDNESHYFNGKQWCEVDDKVLRRIVGKILNRDQTPTTAARVTSVVSVLKDNLQNMGKSNPLNMNVVFANGVVDMASDKELRPHLMSDLNTRTLATNYNTEATCPAFHAWIKEIFSSDNERIGQLQEMFGWLLCRDNLNIQKMIKFIGPTRSGKGLIVKLMQVALGRGASTFTLGSLMDDKTLNGMEGTNVSFDSDCVSPAPKDGKHIVGRLKKMTANEAIDVKTIYKKKSKDKVLGCKLIVVANEAINLYDDSGAVSNRWVPLVFDKSYLGKEDVYLENRLIDEIEGIVMWALNGLEQLIENRQFTMPEMSKAYLESIIEDGGGLNNFIEDCLEIDPQARIKDKDIWSTYRLWMIGNEEPIKITSSRFKQALADALRGEGVQRNKSIRFSDGTFHRGFKGIGRHTRD